MPSLVVHYAFVGLLAATLLGAAFDKRSLLLSILVVTFPDVDAFLGLYWQAGHRAATTNLVIPAVLALLIGVDLYVREESYIKGRWGAYGVRVSWFCVVVYVVGHVLLDLITGGANLFWPLYDQFYQLNGHLELSSQRGIVQTFIELPEPPAQTSGGTGTGGASGGSTTQSMGNSNEVQMSTGIDPNPGQSEPEAVDRVFPIARSGWELVVLVVGTLATAARLRIGHDLPDE
ncbi:metal-dependent hydrolase [Haloarcula sp. NS06]|uniref:metal-dependent hydrolase n=1 Tax=unclassified Haloarcula TaxID=2624677 RepID=UPI0027AF654A|nr:metal-dependent hydrolase [Haloarcula sp. H-GB4]MDQ2072086.1 metal-dependent hydrolase [Haloarcula sp. H-GB4]